MIFSVYVPIRIVIVPFEYLEIAAERRMATRSISLYRQRLRSALIFHKCKYTLGRVNILEARVTPRRTDPLCINERANIRSVIN